MSTIKIDPKELHALSPYLHMQFAEPLSNADISVYAAGNYVDNCWEKKCVKLLKRLSPPMIRGG
ncbi:MAG: alpha-L-arabinofuranosidase, partial [Lentisphaeria bacterium]|nr:alpha-L-arabinofuranosidase [Lentisphaeria bacterium]